MRKNANPASREIMVMLAQAGMTRAELARHMGITRERVYQMISTAGPRAIERLKAAIREASGG